MGPARKPRVLEALGGGGGVSMDSSPPPLVFSRWNVFKTCKMYFLSPLSHSAPASHPSKPSGFLPTRLCYINHP